MTVPQAVQRRTSVRLITAPRLILLTLPWIAGVVLAKLVVDAAGWHIFEVNPLLSGLVGAEVFLLGFLLAGTVGDYKESERLPGELAVALEKMTDDALILHGRTGAPEAVGCVRLLRRIAEGVDGWLHHRTDLASVTADVRAINDFSVAWEKQGALSVRLRDEQANVRRVLTRIEAIRTTSFVAAGYAIAELTAGLVLLGLLLTDLGSLDEALFFSGVITLLLTYVFALIRDLDDPFRYAGGRPGAADISLRALDLVRTRLAAESTALEAAALQDVPVEGELASVRVR